MGLTRVRAGDHVIGSGRSPQTGQNVSGKHGDVTDTRDHFGDQVVEVTWKDGKTDTVTQNNVSGTGLCGRGGKSCRG
ncbi:MAG: hypothetical protein ACRDRL_13565 [Sciscionella sp.]